MLWRMLPYALAKSIHVVQMDFLCSCVSLNVLNRTALCSTQPGVPGMNPFWMRRGMKSFSNMNVVRRRETKRKNSLPCQFSIARGHFTRHIGDGRLCNAANQRNLEASGDIMTQPDKLKYGKEIYTKDGAFLVWRVRDAIHAGTRGILSLR